MTYYRIHSYRSIRSDMILLRRSKIDRLSCYATVSAMTLLRRNSSSIHKIAISIFQKSIN